MVGKRRTITIGRCDMQTIEIPCSESLGCCRAIREVTRTQIRAHFRSWALGVPRSMPQYILVVSNLETPSLAVHGMGFINDSALVSPFTSMRPMRAASVTPWKCVDTRCTHASSLLCQD
jgi:hypothetical protein